VSSKETKLKIIVDAQNNASAGLKSVSKELGVMGNSAKSSSSTVMGLTKSFVGLAGAYLSVSSAFSAAKLGLTVAADMQTAEVGLKTLLGSADKAAATIARLKIEAARTPFELPGLTQAVQLLTSVTKDGDKSIDIILDIGEGLAAMGKGQGELDRIIVNLQQIAAVGKAATIDIKQFAFAGIPIYEMLAETTGKSGEALAEMIENGEITFNILTEMFDKANDAGGRFNNAFVNQAGTFNQASSNMKDSFGIMMSDIVNSSGLFQGVTDAMMQAAEVMSDWRGVIESIKDSASNLFSLINEKTMVVFHLKGAFDAIKETFMNSLKPAIDELMIALIPLKPFGEALATVFGAMLVIAMHTLVAVISTLVQGTTVLLTVFTKVATFISEALSFAISSLSSTIQIVSALIRGDFTGAWDLLIDRLGIVYNWFNKVFNLIIDIGNAIKDFGGSIAKKAFSGVSSILPGRASGGPVSAGMPYMVGEKGPELFVPSSSGGIVPNNRLGGGTTVNIYGGTYLSEDAAERMGDLIMKRLQLSSAI